MSSFGVIDEILEVTDAEESFTNITIGEVVDTNDPQQMGRVRAICPAMGDTRLQALKHVPWAMYGSPFGGVNEVTARGRGNDISEGPVSYGMWAIPKIGSQVLIMCIDGNPAHRVWLGCLPGQFFPHTMPHGRYSAKPDAGNPEGPLTSTENPIEPLHRNLTEAFSGGSADARESFEFRSRGADNQVAHLTPEEIQARVKFSKLADDRNELIFEDDGEVLNHSQGYAKSNIAPEKNFPNTGGVNYDSHIYSWTTPGFHAFHMDDRAESCRMRFRTTAGHQIILDDTNERIYISTAQGKTWIEIDEKGTIDIYGEQDISIRSEADINLTAEQTVRIKGKEGIHFQTDGEFRVYAKDDINFKTDAEFLSFSIAETRIESQADMHIKTSSILFINSTDNMNIKTGAALSVQTGSTLDIKSGASLAMESASSTDIKAGASLAMEAGAAMDIKSGSTMSSKAGSAITIDGSTIDLNSGNSAGSAGSAGAAASAVVANPGEAFLTGRVPEHEPWARVYMTLDADKFTGNTQAVEYPYDSVNVGRKSDARGKDFTRNSKWHR